MPSLPCWSSLVSNYPSVLLKGGGVARLMALMAQGLLALLRARLGNLFQLLSVCDLSSGCGQSRVVAGWRRLPRRRSVTHLT